MRCTCLELIYLTTTGWRFRISDWGFLSCFLKGEQCVVKNHCKRKFKMISIRHETPKTAPTRRIVQKQRAYCIKLVRSTLHSLGWAHSLLRFMTPLFGLLFRILNKTRWSIALAVYKIDVV